MLNFHSTKAMLTKDVSYSDKWEGPIKKIVSPLELSTLIKEKLRPVIHITLFGRICCLCLLHGRVLMMAERILITRAGLVILVGGLAIINSILQVYTRV